jgi:hypothetical protein
MPDSTNTTHPLQGSLRLTALALLLLGSVVWLWPQQILMLVLPRLTQFPGSTISVPDTIAVLGRGVAIVMLLWAGLVLWWSSASTAAAAKLTNVITLLTVLGSYLVMAWTLGGWMIDDAAITFAYSQNLMLGNGLVLHPNLPPEEGYSNTLWMLLVALPLLVGVEVSVAAKIGCVLAGAAAIAIAFWLTLQNAGPRLSLRNVLLFALVATGAPFIIWSASGLETALQALLFVIVVLGAQRGDGGIWLATVALCGLILTRPESPLMVASVTAFWGLHHWRQYGFSGVFKLWPLVVLPLLVTLALLAFRLWYFGDPMPNPYYIKGTGRNFWSVLWGGRYVLLWLLTGFTFVVVPFVLLCDPRRWSLVAVVAGAILVGQLGFLAFSGGDWMAGYRFIAPVLPVLAFLLVYANCTGDSRWATYIPRLTLLAIPLLALGSVRQLAQFEVNPATPISRVSELAYGIKDVADRMGISNPTVAHHDAGGISYEVGLQLLDLGGLGNRYIAKNFNYPRRIWEYVMVEQQPDFIYGSVVVGFAAKRSEFYKSKKFAEDYVKLEFPGQPHMSANLGPGHLSHVRREWVKPGPGIELVYAGDKLVKVIITPLEPDEA